MAFKIAGSWRSRKAAQEGQPGVLEPIMKVEVVTPEDYMGDVMGDLNRRRGVLQGQDDTPSGKTIHAQVPLAEMFGYATTSAFDDPGPRHLHDGIRALREAPANIAEAVIKKSLSDRYTSQLHRQLSKKLRKQSWQRVNSNARSRT